MTTTHQTIVVELGSSRIKVGFAGEPKPRCILDNDGSADGEGGWSVGLSDGMVSSACQWKSFFRYFTSSSSEDSAGGSSGAVAGTTVYEWEKTLYPLFSHVLTSILFIQRPSRHRVLLLTNDIYPPSNFREALHRVLLDYLGVGGVRLASGGVFESLCYLLEGLPPPLGATGRPKARLIVDIGTFEARVSVAVTGSSVLEDTYQTTASGYQSFLRQVMANYQEMADESDEADGVAQKSSVITLGDSNAVVQAWASRSASKNDATTISVDRLPSHDGQQTEGAPIILPTQPIVKALRQIYLDFANPSSLIFAMLASLSACPIDYRKAAAQNVLLIGGGSVALRGIRFAQDSTGFSMDLEKAAKEACGILSAVGKGDGEKEEEKKDDGSSMDSSIAKHRFISLSGAVGGHVTNDGMHTGGMHIQYPDPFAADIAAWIGGSVLGTLGLPKYHKKS